LGSNIPGVRYSSTGYDVKGSLDVTQWNPGFFNVAMNSRITKYIHVFALRAAIMRSNSSPIEFSTPRCIQATVIQKPQKPLCLCGEILFLVFWLSDYIEINI